MPRKLPTLEESLDAVCDGVEHVADRVEQAWDDALAQPPATPTCTLSDEERLTAERWFSELVRKQNSLVDGSVPCVYEDAHLALFLQEIGMLGSPEKDEGGHLNNMDLDDAPRRAGLYHGPLVEQMLLKLHRIAVGHWLAADPGRKAYYLEEVSWLKHAAGNHRRPAHLPFPTFQRYRSHALPRRHRR